MLFLGVYPDAPRKELGFLRRPDRESGLPYFSPTLSIISAIVHTWSAIPASVAEVALRLLLSVKSKGTMLLFFNSRSTPSVEPEMAYAYSYDIFSRST